MLTLYAFKQRLAIFLHQDYDNALNEPYVNQSMTASILDGKHVAAQITAELGHSVNEMLKHNKPAPCLAVIRVGEDAASMVYVHNKVKACQSIGIKSIAYELPESTSHEALIALIQELNETIAVNGILVQLPLPKHIHTPTVIETIEVDKDVDGFHPYNLGRLAQGNPTLRPCTPYGIMQLLQHYQLSPKGLRAVVVGASNIVGRPMAFELLYAQATVTICHSATQSLENHVREADILVSATGRAGVINTEWLQKNQIVIDVGIHRQANGRLRGDIDTLAAKERVAWITPVPGGVGPMTICTLLKNTIIAANNQQG